MSRTSSIALIISALIILVGATLAINREALFPLDDAYITIANAETLLGAGADNYGSNRPTGATSLLHLLIISALATLLSAPVASFASAILFTAIYAAGLYRLLETSRAGVTIALLGTLTGLVAGAAWLQLMNGLETGIALAGVTWSLFLTERATTRRDHFALGGLLGILPFTRPELALLSLGLLAAAIYKKRHNLRDGPLPALCAFAGAVALFVAVSWWATGELIPRTAGAKIAYFAESASPLWLKLATTTKLLVLSPIFPIIFGQLFLLPRPIGWAVNGFALAFLATAAMSLPNGIFHNDFRYLYIFMPFGLYGWATLSARAGLTGRIGTITFLIGATVTIASFPFRGWPQYRDALDVTRDREALAVWAIDNLPADSRILIHDAGHFAWRTDFDLVDVVGLKSPEIIDIHERITQPSAGQDRWIAVDQIAREGEVSHAIILDLQFWQDIHGYLVRGGWGLNELRADEAQFYRLYELTPP